MSSHTINGHRHAEESKTAQRETAEDQKNEPAQHGRGRNRWLPIHEAAKEGRLDEIVELAQSGEDLNVQNSSGYTPFHIAAHAGLLDVMQLLVDNGVHIDVPSGDGGQAIHIAAEFGKTAVIRWLIEKGADVNAKDQYDGRPIHYAVGKNHEDAVLCLIENDGQINVKNDTGITPLHYASFYDQPRMVPLLLNFGADKRIRDDQGKTALEVAKEKGHGAVVEQLKKGRWSKNEKPSFAVAADGIQKSRQSVYFPLAAVFSIMICFLAYFYFTDDDPVPVQKQTVKQSTAQPVVKSLPTVSPVRLPDTPEVPEKTTDILDNKPVPPENTSPEKPEVSEQQPSIALTPKKQPPRRLPAEILPHLLIVGSFKNPENAARFSQRLKTMGYLKSTTLKKEQMTLVCIESFDTVANARVRQKEILEKYQFKSWILSRKP